MIIVGCYPAAIPDTSNLSGRMYIAQVMEDLSLHGNPTAFFGLFNSVATH